MGLINVNKFDQFYLINWSIGSFIHLGNKRFFGTAFKVPNVVAGSLTVF